MIVVIFFKDDAQEEFGWKLVHGDVFRPPRNAMFLAVFVGSGSQIIFMVFITLGSTFFAFELIICEEQAFA